MFRVVEMNEPIQTIGAGSYVCGGGGKDLVDKEIHCKAWLHCSPIRFVVTQGSFFLSRTYKQTTLVTH